MSDVREPWGRDSLYDQMWVVKFHICSLRPDGRSYQTKGPLSFRFHHFHRLQGHKNMTDFFVTLEFAERAAFLVLWPSYTDTAVKLTSDAIELHGCLLHESQYLKHRR